MASHSYRSPPPRTCTVCGKAMYATWRHACYDADQMRRKGNRREWPYWSRVCGSYHVGSKPKRRKP